MWDNFIASIALRERWWAYHSVPTLPGIVRCFYCQPRKRLGIFRTVSENFNISIEILSSHRKTLADTFQNWKPKKIYFQLMKFKWSARFSDLFSIHGHTWHQTWAWGGCLELSECEKATAKLPCVSNHFAAGEIFHLMHHNMAPSMPKHLKISSAMRRYCCFHELTSPAQTFHTTACRKNTYKCSLFKKFPRLWDFHTYKSMCWKIDEKFIPLPIKKSRTRYCLYIYISIQYRTHATLIDRNVKIITGPEETHHNQHIAIGGFD